jgi:DNA transposition AAA+ family ATPase
MNENENNDDLSESAKVNQGGNARASWRVSADKLNQHLAHCTPDRKEQVKWAFLWCIEKGIYLKDFATQIGWSETTIDRIIMGRYREPRTGKLYDIPPKLAEAIRAWRKDQVLEQQATETEFVITPTVKKIWTGCDLARESNTPVFLYGASHLGKTWALEHYAVDNNHGGTPMVRIPSSSGLGGMVRAIAAKVGVSSNGTVPDMIERVKRALTSDQVLILDEVHQLIYTYRKESFFACLEVLRSIHDYSRCGMVFCSTKVFQKAMEQEKKAALEQLFCRGVHRVELGNIVLARDMKVIIAHNGLSWPEKGLTLTYDNGKITEKPYEVLKQLAREAGLKAITERIRYAKKFASKARKPLDWQHFCAAHLTIAANAAEPADDW